VGILGLTACCQDSPACRHNLLTLACPGRSGARRHVVETLGSPHCWKTPSEPLPRERIATIRHRRAGAGSEPRSLRLVSNRELQATPPWPRIRRRYRYMGLAGAGPADQHDIVRGSLLGAGGVRGASCSSSLAWPPSGTSGLAGARFSASGLLDLFGFLCLRRSSGAGIRPSLIGVPEKSNSGLTQLFEGLDTP
jgi:hypothetical protein